MTNKVQQRENPAESGSHSPASLSSFTTTTVSMDPANHSTSQSNPPAHSSLPGIANVSQRREGGQPSALTGPAETAQQPLDSRMDTDEDSEMPGLQNVSSIHDDMPGLQDVSDSSDDEDEDDSHDVEMHPPSASNIVPPSSLPSSSSHPESSTRTNGNRRARVEEDDDHERDRRHPSQRVSLARRSPVN